MGCCMMEQVETMPVTDSARSSFKQLMPLLERWLELCSVDACRGTDKQNPVFLCAYMNTPQSAHGRVIVRVETWPHWTYSNQVFTTESKESILSKGCSWCPCQGLPLCSWEIGLSRIWIEAPQISHDPTGPLSFQIALSNGEFVLLVNHICN